MKKYFTIIGVFLLGVALGQCAQMQGTANLYKANWKLLGEWGTNPIDLTLHSPEAQTLFKACMKDPACREQMEKGGAEEKSEQEAK